MSSTNHTQHYGLSQWEPEDAFLREDFNEDHRKVEVALGGKPDIIFGSYLGDGAASREIRLGRRPVAMILMPKDGELVDSGGRAHGGIAGVGYPVMYGSSKVVELNDTGFTVQRGGAYDLCNMSGTTYYYMALVQW